MALMKVFSGRFMNRPYRVRSDSLLGAASSEGPACRGR
ncbi:hypothetical protein THTE_2843 [Thermogutta terrifontis]|uniref:Uncharacterized protein n=1 Tax=Thermogutta terrifontis TaxID=1331910 RepID=A0A286RHJ6_9BACT|nr:hypothetical protein THTE_2843 [Thermogutta terrifontis]